MYYDVLLYNSLGYVITYHIILSAGRPGPSLTFMPSCTAASHSFNLRNSKIRQSVRELAISKFRQSVRKVRNYKFRKFQIQAKSHCGKVCALKQHIARGMGFAALFQKQENGCPDTVWKPGMSYGLIGSPC